MFKFQNKLALVGFLALVALFGTARSARADILLTLTNTTSNITKDGTVLNPDLAIYNGSVGDFSVVISVGSSNSPGSPSSALTQQSTTTIINTGNQTETLQILVSANGFTAPQSPPPLNLLDTVSGSVANGTVSGTAQGFASTTNNLGAEDFASKSLSYSASGQSQSFSASGGVPGFSPNGDTYSLTYLETITLSAGGQITLTGGNVQAVPTPEPATLMMAFSAMPVLGLGYWLRRRQVRPVTAA